MFNNFYLDMFYNWNFLFEEKKDLPETVKVFHKIENKGNRKKIYSQKGKTHLFFVNWNLWKFYSRKKNTWM